MARFVKGDIVVVPFPFSDLSASKRRPALVLSKLDGDDVILCQITSQTVRDKDALPLTKSDFSVNSLKKDSNIRPNKIFTADTHIVLYKIGSLKKEKLDQVITKTIEIIRN